MRRTRLSIVAVATALATMVPSAASADQPLTYSGALTCGAVHVVLSGTQEQQGDAEGAAMLQDVASRWLVMAIMRNGSDGQRAPDDFDARIEALIDRIEDTAGEEAETFLTEAIERCDAMQKAHADEVDAIDLE